MQGYFRDDAPLCELILDEHQRRELDALWHELNFVTLAPMRQYKDFIFFERAEPPRFMREAEFDFARSEDKDATSEAKMTRLAEAYLAKARKQGANAEAMEAIETYFASMSAEIRRVEQARLAAEPSHLEALRRNSPSGPTAGRCRPPSATTCWRSIATLRSKDELGHEEALRDTLVTVLLSPHFCYRVDLAATGHGSAAAVRLRAGQPAELFPLVEHARCRAAGPRRGGRPAQAGGAARPDAADAARSDVSAAWRPSSPATGSISAASRSTTASIAQRFPSFTNELRQAMFEEPIRYFVDMAQRNRSVLDLLYGNDTFVNRAAGQALWHARAAPAARGPDEWVHVEDAQRYGRGGLLPMAVFLTKNAPGLRTSPVKRGYWVVRRLLGEQIPPPPPAVPELPKDEANLGELTLPQVLARHRDNKDCAGCHRRFDSVGLVFEDFGPIGERRDEGPRRPPGADRRRPSPTARSATGLDGPARVSARQAAGRFRRQPVPEAARRTPWAAACCSRTRNCSDEMRTKLAADGYAFGSLVETIVTSPQFLNKRGRDDPRSEQ